MPKTFDAIVLGLGAMGSAATYQLALRGASVLGIDRFAPPHALGSTHGETRITRLACGEGPMYTQFASRSHEIWRGLEGATGRELLTQNGFMVISGPGPRSANHEDRDFLKSTVDIARQYGIAHELLTGAQARARFPAFNLDDDDQIYYERGAGFVRPEACVSAQLEEAGRLGALVHTGETARAFRPSSRQVTVTTDVATYTTNRLVLTVGPWLPGLLGDALAPMFRVTRQVLHWFRIAGGEPAHYRPENFPTFIWQLPAPQPIYGFPALGGAQNGVKIATEQYLTATTPDTVDRTVTVDEIRAMHAAYVAPYFPGLSADCIRTAVCLYTGVERARFIIDFHPDTDRVIVASPCSGHGFKHSAAIGEALAELATLDKTRFDLTSFRIGG